MEIRKLDKPDIVELLELYKHLHEKDSDISIEKIEDVWVQTSTNKTITYIGGFIEGKLVSSCQMVIVPNFTRAGKPFCLIENVVTHSELRNKGYGKKKLNYAIDLAWEKECYKVMLMSGRNEESVIQFYQSVGFSADEKRAFIARPQCT